MEEEEQEPAATLHIPVTDWVPSNLRGRLPSCSKDTSKLGWKAMILDPMTAFVNACSALHGKSRPQGIVRRDPASQPPLQALPPAASFAIRVRSGNGFIDQGVGAAWFQF